MEKWKTIHSEYHYKTPFGNLRKDTCQMPDGRVIDGYYVHEYADWVNAIVLTKEGKIVFVEQYRHPANDLFLEIPAGKMEEGETPEEAIIREVREETGFISEKKPICLGEFFVNPAVQTNKVISFLITEAEQLVEQQLDETEVIDVHLFQLDEVEGLISGKQLSQLFSVSAYYMAKDHFKKATVK
jgi:ADP-ribose pyrophosphatase